MKSVLVSVLAAAVLAACGGGGGDYCTPTMDPVHGAYKDDQGRWHTYDVDDCGNRVETPLPAGLTPSVSQPSHAAAK